MNNKMEINFVFCKKENCIWYDEESNYCTWKCAYSLIKSENCGFIKDKNDEVYLSEALIYDKILY